jgi:hypothetical protein
LVPGRRQALIPGEAGGEGLQKGPEARIGSDGVAVPGVQRTAEDAVRGASSDGVSPSLRPAFGTRVAFVNPARSSQGDVTDRAQKAVWPSVRKVLRVLVLPGGFEPAGRAVRAAARGTRGRGYSLPDSAWPFVKNRV